MRVRLKRMLAFVIDWNITFFPFLIIFSILSGILREGSALDPFVFLLCFVAVLLPFGVFVFRDAIFKGRSLGKRIFGLYIYDEHALKQASMKQCFLRNVFLFLYFVDGILLLVTGQTIGDRVAGTLVTSKQGPETHAKDMQAGHTAPKQNVAKTVVFVITILLVCVVFFVGLIQTVLSTLKGTEEYQVAYQYFVESRAFRDLKVDASKIRFNQYSSRTYVPNDSSSPTQTVNIGFMVNWQSFEIVCHKENGIWQVCSECTRFE